MTYDARQIANWFVERARADGKVLSIMSLLKLTYIAHGWHLEMKKRPLFNNKIEAWQYGPVIPDVYNAFRPQGFSAVKTVPLNSDTQPQQDDELLQQIWDIYGDMSAFQLSDLTHELGGPWHLASETGGYYAPIPNEMIQNHYELKRLRSKQLQDA